jgi:hypothetical protein
MTIGHNVPMQLAFAAVALALLAVPVHAGSAVDASGASHCAIRGYLNDADPKGTNVRAAPSANAPVIGHLPPRAKMKDDDEIVAVEFDIVGAKNGWLLVQNPDRGDFKGPGWLSGRLVGFTIGSPKLLAAPAADAKVVASLQSIGDFGIGPDSFEVRQVHRCQGHWAEVTVVLAPSVGPPPGMHKGPLRGWAGKVCSNQLTTCDPY